MVVHIYVDIPSWMTEIGAKSGPHLHPPDATFVINYDLGSQMVGPTGWQSLVPRDSFNTRAAPALALSSYPSGSDDDLLEEVLTLEWIDVEAMVAHAKLSGSKPRFICVTECTKIRHPPTQHFSMYSP